MNQFQTVQFCGLTMIRRASDGFINVSDICQKANRSEDELMKSLPGDITSKSFQMVDSIIWANPYAGMVIAMNTSVEFRYHAIRLYTKHNGSLSPNFEQDEAPVIGNKEENK